MTAPDPAQVLADTARALHKIDRWGARGVTMVTHREIEAMALTLVGLIAQLPTPPTPTETDQ